MNKEFNYKFSTDISNLLERNDIPSGYRGAVAYFVHRMIGDFDAIPGKGVYVSDEKVDSKHWFEVRYPSLNGDFLQVSCDVLDDNNFKSKDSKNDTADLEIILIKDGDLYKISGNIIIKDSNYFDIKNVQVSYYKNSAMSYLQDYKNRNEGTETYDFSSVGIEPDVSYKVEEFQRGWKNDISYYESSVLEPVISSDYVGNLDKKNVFEAVEEIMNVAKERKK